MKKCPYCAEEIQDEAIVCRFCGKDLIKMPGRLVQPAPVKKKTNRSGCIIGLVLVGLVMICGLVFIIIFGSLLVESDSSLTSSRIATTPTISLEQMKASAKNYNYDDLARNTELYIGDVVHYQGEIIQVIEGLSNKYDLRVNITKIDYGWDDTVYVNYKGPRVLEDDVIDFYGVIDGRITYETVLGASVTIPEITAISLTVIR